MAKQTSIADELKALGAELATAFKQARSSKEFQDLEKEIATGVRNVSSSLIKSLRAAKNSQEAGRLKKRVGRVVKMGQEKGREEAEKAAKKGLKKFNQAFDKLSKKLKPE